MNLEERIFVDTTSIRDFMLRKSSIDYPTQSKIILDTTSQSNNIYEYEHSNGQIMLRAVKVLGGFELFRKVNLYTVDEIDGLDHNTFECPQDFVSIGKLDSNIYGTKYEMILNNDSSGSGTKMLVNYDVNYLKKDKPRCFEILLNNIKLVNKKPIYNLDQNTYSLNFSGRVTVASVKNFQIIHPLDPTFITLTFGKESSSEFILDFMYPWCPIEAFCLGLTALDHKMGFE